MENRMITILVKEPGKAWHAVEVEDDLKTYQDIVGGYIEGIATTSRGVLIFGNEEGKLLNLEPNFGIHGDLIVGTVFAVRDNYDGEFDSVTQEDIDWFTKWPQYL